MSYELSVSPGAQRQIAAQPDLLREFITSSLDQLAAQPGSIGRSSATVTGGQLAEFEFDREGVIVWIAVTFLYGQDEQTLHVENVAVEYGA